MNGIDLNPTMVDIRKRIEAERAQGYLDVSSGQVAVDRRVLWAALEDIERDRLRIKAANVPAICQRCGQPQRDDRGIRTRMMPTGDGTGWVCYPRCDGKG